jgi:hypothetical protein
MSNERDKLWSAYIDGELSAAEASKFDQSLTADERARLASEIQLENGIGEILQTDTPCPDPLWKRVEGELYQHDALARQSRRNVLWWAGSVAAILLFAVSAYMYNVRTVAEPPFMRLASCMEEQEKLAEVSSPDGVEDLLHRVGISLDLHMPSPQTWTPAHHHVQLLGAMHSSYHGNPVVVLLFECCKQPVNIVLARRGSPAAQQIGTAVSHGKVQMSRPLGIYVAAVIGRHEANDVLTFVQAKTCHPSTPEE